MGSASRPPGRTGPSGFTPAAYRLERSETPKAIPASRLDGSPGFGRHGTDGSDSFLEQLFIEPVGQFGEVWRGRDRGVTHSFHFHEFTRCAALLEFRDQIARLPDRNQFVRIAVND